MSEGRPIVPAQPRARGFHLTSDNGAFDPFEHGRSEKSGAAAGIRCIREVVQILWSAGLICYDLRVMFAPPVAKPKTKAVSASQDVGQTSSGRDRLLPDCHPAEHKRDTRHVLTPTGVTSSSLSGDFSAIPLFAPERTHLQRRLVVGSIDDPQEREADGIADHVMRGFAAAVHHSAPVQALRKCDECEKKEEDDEGRPNLRRKSVESVGPVSGRALAPPSVTAALASPALRLDSPARSFLEPRFGRSLGNIRIHSDPAAARSAHALSARAYTVGRDIVFAPGQYSPDTFQGRWLLAHEVAHTIQQSSGSAPANTIVQRKPTGAQPAPLAERRVSINITVEKPMTPHEFAVRALMQAFRMPGDLAEQRVSAIEAAGRSAGTGPHFERGVRPDEVGKPLKLNYPLPPLSEAEQADVKGRAEQLAELPRDERSAVDEETDRRFWQQTGKGKGTKLSPTSGRDALSRSLWMRTRDEVVRDRNRIAALPARTKSLLLPDDKQPTPEQYATVLRIAEKLDKFSEDDWALYQRRINASTSDFAVFEASVDRFRARQQSEGALNSRIQGMTALYKAYRAARDTPKPFMGVGGGVSSGQIPGHDERYRKAQDDYAAALKANSFRDAAEFEAVVANWKQLFRSRAVELTLLVLNASEQVVRAELTRYQDPANVAALHAKTATLRKLDTEETAAHIRTLPTMTQVRASGHGPKTAAQEAAAKEAKEKHAASEAERAKLAEDHPILKDPRLHTYRLNTGDPSEFGSRLRGNASDRLADITKTRHRVLTDPDAILSVRPSPRVGAAGARRGRRGVRRAADRRRPHERDRQGRHAAWASDRGARDRPRRVDLRHGYDCGARRGGGAVTERLLRVRGVGQVRQGVSRRPHGVRRRQVGLK